MGKDYRRNWRQLLDVVVAIVFGLFVCWLVIFSLLCLSSVGLFVVSY